MSQLPTAMPAGFALEELEPRQEMYCRYAYIPYLDGEGWGMRLRFIYVEVCGL